MILRRIISLLFVGFVLLLFQGIILRSLLPGAYVPHLLVIPVVFLAFYEISPLGAVLSFALGLEYDLVSGMVLGPWAGAFVVGYFLIASVSQRIFVESPLTTTLVTLVTSLLTDFVYLILLYQFKPVHAGHVSGSLIGALLAAVLAPLLFRFLRLVIWRRPTTVGGKKQKLSYQAQSR